MANAYIDHPVVDATTLEGGWNFLMGWTPKAILEKPPILTKTGMALFEAVERELGLKLVKQKRSVPVIVVDHVDEEPIQ